ncbi:unnamed protein product [Ilex paraguariensis]|uniref:Nuclear pore complex protein n=1 Tax=Ilex paraguariensis TaxID=185542 RepID=A0ABC8UDM7_9AQUA
MVSPKQLLSTIESSLLGPTPPSPSQRIELIHAIRHSLSSFKSLLSYPPPRPSDRTQVQSREARLPDSGPISLDDQDVKIALKLSDDLHLNEIDSVRLLVSANQEAVVLDQGLEADIVADIQKYLEDLINAGLRQRLILLIKLLRRNNSEDNEGIMCCPALAYALYWDMEKLEELNRDEPAGLGGPNCERYVLDSRGALVERRAVVGRERLILGHCLVLSVLVVRISLRYGYDPCLNGAQNLAPALLLLAYLCWFKWIVKPSTVILIIGPKDVRDVFSLLKDSAAELSGSSDPLKHQITYSLLFSLVIALVSDALSAAQDKESVLSHEAPFRHEFQETVIAAGNDPMVEGFVDCVRLAWAVHLMLVQDGIDEGDAASGASYMRNGCSCLELIFSNNVFQFSLDNILRTAAYQLGANMGCMEDGRACLRYGYDPCLNGAQNLAPALLLNDDEDIIYMYNAYLHKLITCFLSHPVVRDKVKETKEKAMSALSPYHMARSHDYMLDNGVHSQHAAEATPQPFVSLLEFVSEIYQKEPDLLSGNDVLWTFVNFAGEDHTNFQTLVAFLKMLSTLASSQEGASIVFELLHGKTFRSIGWSTLFDCLSIYDEKFKQSLQTAGAILPEMQEGDAKALVAYLNVLQKVVENGNPIERKNWFPDIESLFKLLGYENVPPYLKGALRNAIATFIQVSPVLKDTIWSYLEQYDLPVVVGSHIGSSIQPMATQVYDMRFELNELEARREQYPSTISFLNLLNALISEERDVSDRGHRFIGIFRFVYDHVFGPFPQRAYADPCEKWQLVVACLQHFRMILTMYDVKDEDIDIVVDEPPLSAGAQLAPLQMQLPVIELLKDFMSGKTVFRNIMGILLSGVNSIINQRTTQIYGQLLEDAVLLSLEIILLVLEKDAVVSDFWRPLYLLIIHFMLSVDDDNDFVLFLYDSSRMVGLVELLLKSNAASCLIEDYAACLELRSEECQIIEDSSNDSGVLIMKLLIDNIGRPAPNITHLLLKFDLDTPVERTLLQPKFHYSCLKVILDILEKLLKPDVNAVLHEFGFQLLYELCLDPLTCGPTMDMLSNKKYQFFVKHLETIGVAPLPKRISNQTLRISSLHQRAWLLKLLAIELHTGEMTTSTHRETCQSILAHVFGQNIAEWGTDHNISHSILQSSPASGGTTTISKSKVLMDKID